MNTIHSKGTLALILSLLLVFSCTSCRKTGCTDAKAINYNARAKKDDHSCEFSTSIHLWLSFSTADSLGLSFPIKVSIRQNYVGDFQKEDLRSLAPNSCVEEKNTILSVEHFNEGTSGLLIQLQNKENEVVFERVLKELKPDECRKVKI